MTVLIMNIIYYLIRTFKPHLSVLSPQVRPLPPHTTHTMSSKPLSCATTGDAPVPPNSFPYMDKPQCDFCDCSSDLREFNLNGFMGWRVCGNCTAKFHENKKHFCLPLGEIFKSFPDGKFNVIRFSGSIETGWYIQEPVVRYGIGTEYTVVIYNTPTETKDTLQKTIDLGVLQQWQFGNPK
jgi:hypothetical protein